MQLGEQRAAGPREDLITRAGQLIGQFPCLQTAAPNQPVILTVVEMKRLARNAAELMTLSSTLQANGIQLGLISGPLRGVYDPHGAGAIVFAVLAVAAEVEREGIREKTLEGLDTAARKGNHGGRPSVVDDDKLAVARARHAKGESVTAIAKALGIGRATLTATSVRVPETGAQGRSQALT
ncbi:recombinase family protein, partial [Streptomyces syringium]|uniref:recombinase family protein n=1 Tax=Streptomyces syringium TaxID=76729 RepID=UPI0033E840BE